MIVMMSTSFVFGLPFMGSAMVFMILYMWARKNPESPASLFGFELQAFYLPWALVAFHILIGTPDPSGLRSHAHALTHAHSYFAACLQATACSCRCSASQLAMCTIFLSTSRQTKPGSTSSARLDSSSISLVGRPQERARRAQAVRRRMAHGATNNQGRTLAIHGGQGACLARHEGREMAIRRGAMCEAGEKNAGV